MRESTGWLSDAIRYRREAHLAKVLMKAAEKIKASGLPAHAVRDKLLRAVVEDGSMENNEGMQERWATLLANAATDNEDKIKLAYPEFSPSLNRRKPCCWNGCRRRRQIRMKNPSRPLALRSRTTSSISPSFTTWTASACCD